MPGALLDTSVLIAAAGAVDPPAAAAISVVSIGELRAGVLRAPNATIRAARQARFAAIREAFEPLPVSEEVAMAYGEILASARTERRITTATDLLIVATAAASGRSLQTRDDRQARLAEHAGVPLR